MVPGVNSMDGLRAITAVIALYAFVLQGFLGGLMPAAPAADGVLCLQHADDTAPDTAVPHAHADCCLAAHIAGTALPARAAPESHSWPFRAETRIAYAAEVANGARAPPGSIARPRGPPSV